MVAQREQQGVESVEVGGRLLAALARSDEPMMLRDLAAAAGMPPAKAHRYLVSFGRLGMVEQLPDSGRYDVGPLAIRLGLAGIGRLDAMRVAGAALAALRDELHQTVALAVWGNHGPTIVRWLDSNAPVSASLRTGSVMPLTRSATGLAFLAFRHRDATAALLAAELAENRRLGLSPGSTDEAGRIVEESRAHGIARVTGDLVAGVHSVAAPIYDVSGAMTMALIALGYSASFDAGWDGPVARAVKARAADVSDRLAAPATGTATFRPPLPAE